MPKRIVFIARGITQDFDEVLCWPKQWFPDDAYDVRAEPLGDGSTDYRVVVTPGDLPVPSRDVYSTVEVGVDFFNGGEADPVVSLRDTVRVPGPDPDDEEACDPICVE
jgi:hypothetical protein